LFAAPILGDNIHSKSEVHERIRATTQVPKDRLFLHASHMSFIVSDTTFYDAQ
jgi:23S rRNA-/tRNA-specific pseudouridylate synthase